MTYGYSGELTRNKLLSRWEPWDKTRTIILKKIINPVPMFAQTIKPLKFPVLGKAVGLDLQIGDWVAPYGKGKTKDFIFTFKNIYKKGQSIHAPYLASFDLSFPNKFDGIQKYLQIGNDRSEFRWPYKASKEGYETELNKFISFNLNGKSLRKTNITKGANKLGRSGYIFRTRTQVNEKGEIISARYGKVHGDFELFGSGYIKFTYYFNPANNRSLEFDLKKNLFKWNKKEWERTNTLKP